MTDTKDGSSPDVAVGDPAKDGGPNAVPGAPVLGAYATEVMKDAPVAYYRLAETSFPDNPLQPQIRDEIEGKLIGTRTGTLTPNVSGALAKDPNSAMTFDTGYLELGDRFAFSGSAAFTLELWIKVTSSTFSHVITKQDRGDPKNGWAILTNANAISFERYVTNVEKSIQTSLQTSTFFSHVAATYDGAMLRLYINGKLATQTADSRSMPLSSSPLLLATENVGGTGLLFHGSLDEVAIYDKALDQTRVKAHVDASLK